MFIDRAPELAFPEHQHPGPGQFVMLYGRRRVGKTALLRAWAEQRGILFTYWVAEKDPAPLQRRKLFGAFLQSMRADLLAPTFASWSELWRSMAQLLAGRRHLIIIDELPYAAESDPAMRSALQHAWDQQRRWREPAPARCRHTGLRDPSSDHDRCLRCPGAAGLIVHHHTSSSRCAGNVRFVPVSAR
jgi:hypothetical protein